MTSSKGIVPRADIAWVAFGIIGTMVLTSVAWEARPYVEGWDRALLLIMLGFVVGLSIRTTINIVKAAYWRGRLDTLRDLERMYAQRGIE